jgi:hypothetical protein
MSHRRSLLLSFVVLAAVAVLGAFATQGGAWKKPPPMAAAHPNVPAGADCMMCHKAGMQRPAPADHATIPTTMCLLCHAKDAAVQTKVPPAMAAAHPRLPAGADCMMCHKAGMAKPAPADHAGRDVKYCGLCHKPAA